MSPTVTLPIGASKVTLTVNDGEVDSAPSNASVAVTDFLLAAPPSQVILNRGQSTTFDLAITPKYGSFDAAVALTCGDLPAGVTCSFSANSVTPGPQGTAAAVTLTASPNAGLPDHSQPVLAIWLGGLPIFGVLLTGSLCRKRRAGVIVLLLLLVGIFGLVACGGGGGSTSVSKPAPNPGTTSMITVTGNAGGLQHSTNIALTIQ